MTRILVEPFMRKYLFIRIKDDLYIHTYHCEIYFYTKCDNLKKTLVLFLISGVTHQQY